MRKRQIEIHQGLVAFLVLVASAWAEPEAPVLRVATLNIAHGRALAKSQAGLSKETAERNIDAAAELLRRERADVVALQEADAPSLWSGAFDHVERIRAAAGYAHAHHGIHFDQGLGPVRIRYGTALLADRPLLEPESRPFEANAINSKGFVTAEIEFDGGMVLVVSVHLNSDSPDIRRRQADELIKTLADPCMPLVILGDLNSRWSREQDAARRIAEGLNLAAHEPTEEGRFTFPAQAPRMRIDWILITPDLEFASYRTWPDQVSDHLGVMAELRRRKTK